MMRELSLMAGEVNSGGLDAALKAVMGSKVLGVSTYGPLRPISVWLDETTTPGDDADATSIVSAHDPVFLSVNRTSIPADGATEAVVTVRAPGKNAADVSLIVAGTVVPVTLINGVGTIRVSSADPASIPVSVQNPANRSTDSLTVEAT